MRNRKRVILITLTVGLCLTVRMAFAMCQKAVSTTVEGTVSDCSSSCVKYVYMPAVMRCKDTCDTLTCNPGEWVVTTQYWWVGTCSGGRCINITTGTIPGAYVQEYNSDDGCTTPCDG
jgi:hypothetical protein